uniref:PUB domain-containing protein n=1 Tax=Schizophyllum commune (strain H4-8 / FGSC 9210) TaxID=578458 RepID=D8PQ28_SCHCM
MTASPDAALAAVERRLQSVPHQPSAAQLAAEHDKRQKMRRMIDPGIVRPNSKEQALASMKILLTIADNLIKEPENPKYQQFKPTNNTIKRNLVDVKGALEYAVEPYYKFNPKHRHELEIGAACLREYVNRETEKADRAAEAKKNEKAAKEAAALKVKLAYMDDRQRKMELDERERVAREARERARAAAEALKAASPSSPQASEQMIDDDEDDEEEGMRRPRRRTMPGTGHVLGAPAQMEE